MTLPRYFSAITYYGCFLIVLVLGSGCQESIPEKGHPLLTGHIAANHPYLQYTGRINFQDSLAPVWYWAGTQVRANFTGTALQVRLSDTSELNYYQAILDGDRAHPVVLQTQAGTHIYPIFSGLADTVHTVTFLRRTDPTSPPTQFLGFQLDSGKTLLPPPVPPPLKMEFFGNSITSAHGVLDESRENNQDLSTWNADMSYAAMSARDLNASYHMTSRSGIGIMISWYDLIMPEMWKRLDPADPKSEWDFGLYQPDIVVVNLFQNDSWLIERLDPVPDEAAIVQAYIDFVQEVRQTYPAAEVFCVLGNMDITRAGSPWPGYVSAAVNRMQTGPNPDQHLHFLVFPYKQSGGHPTFSEQADMAQLLTDFIRQKMGEALTGVFGA